MAKIIGIDLGTSNSAAAVLEGGRPVLIPSSEGTSLYGKSFPSYVAFTKDGQRLMGEPAKRQAVANAEGTVNAFKRKMGTDYKYNIYGKEYTPQELSAMLLQKIKEDAEAFLGESITKAVITVPAYFNDNQRQATKDAGQIAGLEVVRLVNEPTAASLAYGIDKHGKDMKILVYDFGGGTLDVTVMEFGNGVFEVKSTNGDTQLGGTDMDNAIADFLLSEVKKSQGIDISKDKQAMQRIREAGERAKIELSTTINSDINLPFLGMGPGNAPVHFTYSFTRAKLEEIVMPIVEKTTKPVVNALKDAKLEPKDIEKVILVGGPTRMPIVQRYVEQLLGKKIERGVDPMEAVAFGAAIQAGVLTGEVKDIVLLDVTPLSLGIETLGGVMTKLIEKNTTIPIKKGQVFSTADDSQTTVDIHILQGERAMSKDNIELGRFMLTGIPPAPRGVPQIEVSFDIDANGILHVTAKDKATGKEQGMQVVAPHKMSKEEIEKKTKEAEEAAEEDKKIREYVELKNNIESLVYIAEKQLKENGSKVSASAKEGVEKAISEVKEAIQKEDKELMAQKFDSLNQNLQAMGAEMYKQSGNSGQQTGQDGQDGQGPADSSADAGAPEEKGEK
ncbi:MAG: molecular chaperone DnaK [Candidatus Micrarchaeota archaeon]|nr:molecular chaperone DnaK [Candidatus Micrarchaeota archaeon]MDE1847806.1 molecular chaperone DnaK [Candidatus Micrarchaeota archaeon]MDE1864244.1 molecular chaperone DnaK [Candidatus Micrarchaeota archaeon]